MLQIGVGDTSTAAPDFVTVSVFPGQTVNVSNLAGATLNYFLNGIDGTASTLAPTANVNLTQSTWLQSPGAVTTVVLTGGMYG